MTRRDDERRAGVWLLDADGPSLASGAPLTPAGTTAPPGTLYLRSARGGLAASPDTAFTLTFGRDEPNVHVPVGVGDRHVSRLHGQVTREAGRWTLANFGRLPLRLPGSVNLLTEASTALAPGYTPILVKYGSCPTHVIEAFVDETSGVRDDGAHGTDTTAHHTVWPLSATERLTLIVLGRRYLCHERYAQPLSWAQTAEDLAEITGDPTWGTRRVERLVGGVRTRLSRAGVPGLTRDEVGEPVGNALNHNLITELLLSTTLVPPDLAEIDALDW